MENEHPYFKVVLDRDGNRDTAGAKGPSLCLEMATGVAISRRLYGDHGRYIHVQFETIY